MAKQERRLNKRFVTILTIGIMVLLTIIIAVMIIATSRKDPQIYSDRGDNFMKQGNYVEAAKNYGNAFRYSKKNPKWLVKIAEAQYQGGDERKAMGSLHSAVVADSTLVSAQKRMLEIYYELIGRTANPAAMKTMEEEADRLIKMIPETSKDPELKKTLALGYHCRGVARYGRRVEDPNLGKLAAEDINRAIGLDEKPDYVVSKAMMILGEAQDMIRAARSEGISPETYDEFIAKMRQQIGKAEELYLSLAKVSKENAEALDTLGDFYFQIWGNTELSMGGYCQNLAEGLSANVAQINRQLEDLAAGKKISGEEKRRIRQKAENQKGQWKREIPEWTRRSEQHNQQAKKCFAKALELYKNAVAVAHTKGLKVFSRISLANYYLANNDLGKAEKLIREAVQLDPGGFMAYRMLAEALKRSGDRAGGKTQEANQAEAINILVKRIYEIPTKMEGAKGRQNRILRLELMARVVDLYLDRNKGDDLKKADAAIKELSQSELAEAPAMYLLQARRSLAENDTVTAIKLLEKADTLSSEQNPQVKLALAELYARRGELGAAKKAVMSGLALAPNAMNGWRLAATVFLRLGDTSTALGYAERILAQPGQEKDLGALALKLECLVRMNRLQDADEVAKEMNVLGAKFDWNAQKARLLLEQGKLAEAETLLKQILLEKPGDKTASAYLVEIYVGQNKKSEIPGVLKAALEKNPKDKGLMRLQEIVAISDPKKQFERMKTVSKELTEENLSQALSQAEGEKDPYTRAVRLADQYIQRNDMDQGRKYLDEAVKLNSKRANPINFKFSLITKDWNRARKCADFAKVENLDTVKGMLYEAEITNAQGWDLVVKVQRAQEAKKPDEAKKYEDQARGFFEQSAKAAEQVITELPNDSQGHALLGEAYYWLDRQSEASTQINKALELNPTNPYALRAMSIQEWNEIITRGNLVSRDVVRAFAAHIRAAYQQRPWDDWIKDRVTWLRQQVEKQQEFQEDDAGDARKALARREEKRKVDPGNTENLIRLATIYENREAVRDLDKAEICFRQVLEAAPSRELVKLYLDFANRNKRVEGMEKYMTDLAARQAKTGKAMGYSILGYFYLAIGEIKKSENAFTEAVKVEDTPAKRLDLAAFYTQVNNLEKSAEWCRKTLEAKTTPQQEKSVRNLLINDLLTMNKWDQAKAQIEEYRKLYTDNEGKLFEVRLAIGQGQTSEAERLLTAILDKNPENIDALNQRASMYLYTWQLDKARMDLEKMSKINSSEFGLDGRIKLVKLQCELGRLSDAEQDAREMITQAVTQSPEWIERLRVEMLPALASALPEKTYDEFLAWVSNLTRGYWGWLYERGQFLQLRGKYDQAEQSFGAAWETVENNAKAPEGLKLMILDSYLGVMFRQHEYSKVIQKAERALLRLPKNSSRVVCWQAAAYYANGHKKKGLDLFLKALDSSENNPLIVWQMTRNTMLKAAPASALATALEESMQSSKKALEGKQVALASCYFAADQIEKGAAGYRKLVAETKDPKDKTVILYILAQDLTEKRKYPEGVAVLTEAKRYSSDNSAILNNLAYILEEYLNNPKDAMPLIEEAYRTAPNNADLLDTYGQVLSKVDRTEEGLYHLAMSVWTRESSASRYHLGIVLLKQNRKRDAEIQLRRALQLVGEDKVLEKQIREAMSKI
jgi:tetratricopeptide (TPR) repeat protein